MPSMEGTLAKVRPIVAEFDPDVFVAQLGYRHWVAKIFLPAIGKVVEGSGLVFRRGGDVVEFDDRGYRHFV